MGHAKTRRTMASTDRLKYAAVEGAAALFSPAFADYLVRLHDAFTPRVHAIRAQRERVLRDALERGTLPGPLPPSPATTTDWQVPPVPDDLRKPGIEISGPC